MAGDKISGEVAGTDDGIVGLVSDVELAQLPLHRIRRSRRVGNQDDGAALAAEVLEGFAGFGKGDETVMYDAPDVAEQHIHPADEIAQPFGKFQRRHVRLGR